MTAKTDRNAMYISYAKLLDRMKVWLDDCNHNSACDKKESKVASVSLYELDTFQLCLSSASYASDNTVMWCFDVQPIR